MAVTTKVKQLTPKQALLFVLFVGLIVALCFQYWDSKKLRENVGGIHNQLEALWSNSGVGYNPDAFTEKTETNPWQASYKLISQKVIDMDVMDDSQSYVPGSDGPVYKTQKVRVIELEVTNNGRPFTVLTAQLVRSTKTVKS